MKKIVFLIARAGFMLVFFQASGAVTTGKPGWATPKRTTPNFSKSPEDPSVNSVTTGKPSVPTEDVLIDYKITLVVKEFHTLSNRVKKILIKSSFVKYGIKGFQIVEMGLFDSDLDIVDISKNTALKYKNQYDHELQTLQTLHYYHKNYMKIAFFEQWNFFIIQKIFEGKDFILRGLAVKIALNYGEEGKDIIRQGFNDLSKFVRLEALGVISNLGEEGLSLIKNGLRDKNQVIREASKQAAKSYGEEGLLAIKEAQVLNRGFKNFCLRIFKKK